MYDALISDCVKLHLSGELWHQSEGQSQSDEEWWKGGNETGAEVRISEKDNNG